MSSCPGSALIVVLVSTALIMICATNIWQNSSFFLHVTLARQQYAQRLYATQGLLMLGAAICKHNEKLVFEDSFSTLLLFDRWQCGNAYCEGKLSIKHEAEKVVCLQAVLFDQKKLIFSLSCRIMNINPGKLEINEWTINAC